MRSCYGLNTSSCIKGDVIGSKLILYFVLRGYIMKLSTDDFTEEELGMLSALDSHERNNYRILKRLTAKVTRMFLTCHDDVTD
jgi:hypothetical protein